MKMDFPGIGNLVLRVLMERDQETNPNVDARTIARHLVAVVFAQFGILPGRSYCVPHSDVHLPAVLRDQWMQDEFPRTLIFAYVLGATWLTLPPPDDKLIPYYQLMAERQTSILVHVSAACQNSRREENRADLNAEMADEIASHIEKCRGKGMSKQEIDAEVDYIKQHYANRV